MHQSHTHIVIDLLIILDSGKYKWQSSRHLFLFSGYWEFPDWWTHMALQEEMQILASDIEQMLSRNMGHPQVDLKATSGSK